MLNRRLRRAFRSGNTAKFRYLWLNQMERRENL